MSKNGDHYWVLAHVTPSFGAGGEIVGFHSNRRKPSETAVSSIKTLYQDLKQIEDRPSNRKDGMLEATETLHGMLTKKEVEYDRFVLAL